MQVGGLRVVDRAIRQLARLRDARVVIADDGSIPLPRRLPRNMERRSIEGDPLAAIDVLRTELGSDDAEMRWLTVNALAALCALSDDELARLASADPDENVRALAEKKRKATCGH